MSSLTITKVITYEDPTTGTDYALTSNIVIECSVVQRNQFTLSTGSSTNIFENGRIPFSTGKVAYIFIQNTGANSAYIAIQDNVSANGTQHEIPAGSSMDLFGEDISISGTDTLTYIYAKGNTTLEVDVFM